MFKVYGAALDQNITSNPANSPLDKQGRNCRLLLLVEIAGSEWYVHSQGPAVWLQVKAVQVPGTSRIRGVGRSASTSLALSYLLPRPVQSHQSFSITKILLSVKRQLCMGHIQVVEGHLMLSTGWTTWWLLFQGINSSFILFCQCCEAHHLNFSFPFLFYQLNFFFLKCELISPVNSLLVLVRLFPADLFCSLQATAKGIGNSG